MIKIGILTLSDKGSCGERVDESGKLIAKMVRKIGGKVIYYDIIPDERNLIARKLKFMADKLKCELILTTGGTGLSLRDVTPEATKDVIDREAPGISEAMRAAGLRKCKRAILSRGISGTRKKTLIINLPGSPKAVKESLEAVLAELPHAVEILTGKTSECARR